MDMSTSDLTVHDEPDTSRYTLRLDREIVSFADYSIDGDVVTLPHVETDPAHRGQGYAAALMDGMLASIRSQDRRVRPVCPYAASYMRDRPESHDLVAT